MDDQLHNDEPPEDWGHEDCEVCNKARLIAAAPKSYAAGFRAGHAVGAEAMREKAAKHIEGGRATPDVRVTSELLANMTPAAMQMIVADAEAATRQVIVLVIRALPLPEPPK